ncbi:SDR family oxidoreductase (plasmid) [Peteryoungia desertarenae]|uniref:SDR family oxidoreductase n=1 Tax=Peteryoungia desertarenae TaxID=1813451 RepID=A0ABX6QT44_9HYPH|nr:SDR family oxidoreductase [Peteryoungia desertarenae]QLF71669.1 SDR family oxidoreductase [Peteryoungia desertarenae]
MSKPFVLVLGARSDIALAIAERFAVVGHPLLLAARRSTEMAEIAERLAERSKVDVGLCELDVLATDALEEFVAALPHEPEIVISAIGLMEPVQEACERDVDAASLIMRTNFEAPALLLGLFANRFAARGHGTIVGISSVSGDRGRAKNYVYGAAKAGFTAFLSGLRNRLVEHNVHVVTVIPGFVETRKNRHIKTSARLTAQPSEVAEAVYQAVIRKRDVVYVRPIWRYIMLAIRMTPERFFKTRKI